MAGTKTTTNRANSSPIGQRTGGFHSARFRARRAAEQEMRFLLEDLRAENPDAPDGDDFGVYIQHRQF